MKVNQAERPTLPPIAFEKVSVHEARKALDEQRPAHQKNWARHRSPAMPLQMLHETRKWLLGLPPEVRPLQLAKRFPWVANKLAMLWKRPAQCEQYIAELLIVRRSDNTMRQGFPVPVVREITALNEYFMALHPLAPVTRNRALEWS